MTKFYFVPDDWELSDDLRTWTKAKGVSDAQIETELESFRDHQYKRAMMRPDACWRNWIKNGIKWGNIETVSPSQYRRPVELTKEQQEAERRRGEDNLRQLQEKVSNLKGVK